MYCTGHSFVVKSKRCLKFIQLPYLFSKFYCRFGRKKTTVAYMILAGVTIVAVSFIPHGTNNVGNKQHLVDFKIYLTKILCEHLFLCFKSSLVFLNTLNWKLLIQIDVKTVK